MTRQGRQASHRQPRRGNGPRPAEPRLAEAEPHRTCIVTREQRPPDQLLRISLQDGAVVAHAGRGGRGAYVTIDRDALAQLDERAIQRALREPVKSFDSRAFAKSLRELARARVLDAAGLARRMGRLVIGLEGIERELRGALAPKPSDAAAPSAQRLDVAAAERQGIVLVAPDLSDRSRADAQRSGWLFVPGAELGAAAGLGWAGALGILPGHVAREAAYWLAVWYEAGAVADPLDEQSSKAEPVPSDRGES